MSALASTPTTTRDLLNGFPLAAFVTPDAWQPHARRRIGDSGQNDRTCHTHRTPCTAALSATIAIRGLVDPFQRSGCRTAPSWCGARPPVPPVGAAGGAPRR